MTKNQNKVTKNATQHSKYEAIEDRGYLHTEPNALLILGLSQLVSSQFDFTGIQNPNIEKEVNRRFQLGWAPFGKLRNVF